jgi:hypothetical protein
MGETHVGSALENAGEKDGEPQSNASKPVSAESKSLQIQLFQVTEAANKRN